MQEYIKSGTQNVELYVVKNGVKKVLSRGPRPFSKTFKYSATDNFNNSALGVAVCTLLFKAATVPENVGELRVRGKLFSIRYSTGVLAQTAQPAFFDIRVRKDGEKTLAPKVSHYQPILRVTSRIAPPSKPGDTHRIRLRVHLRGCVYSRRRLEIPVG
jgi:hypothetical protein